MGILTSEKFEKWVIKESKVLDKEFVDLQVIEGKANEAAGDLVALKDVVAQMKGITGEIEHLLKTLRTIYAKVDTQRYKLSRNQEIGIQSRMSQIYTQAEDIKGRVEILKKQRAYLISLVGKVNGHVSDVHSALRKLKSHGHSSEKYCDKIDELAVHIQAELNPRVADVTSKVQGQMSGARKPKMRWINR